MMGVTQRPLHDFNHRVISDNNGQSRLWPPLDSLSASVGWWFNVYIACVITSNSGKVLMARIELMPYSDDLQAILVTSQVNLV